MKQLEPLKTGDTYAVMKTNLGEITLKLFKDEVPKTVENFVTHAKNGYYNGLIFHRVIENFMIQGGDPTGTGMGGESIWGSSFKDEFTPELHNLRGALSMANAGPNTNGSQFFIVQAKEVPSDLIDQMQQMPEESYPTECIKAYETMGGTPWLDYKHTVFGQVVDGMDTVDAIATAKADYMSNKPFKDIVIESLEIKEM